MIQTPPAQLSPENLRSIAAIVKAEAGLHIADTTEALVLSRLSRRLRHSACAGFSEYLALVTAPEGQAERAAMVEALTTNTTRFFREPAHFSILTDRLVPRLRAKLARGQRVRLWSAGCSTGEEPYSMAATLLAAMPDAPRQDLRILATDINTAVLATAAAGQYPRARAEDLTIAQRDSLFEPGLSDPFRVKQPLRDMITFRPLNLMGDWPMSGPFDAIFCRNVAIYMDQPTQWRLWSRLDALLDQGGILFIGHSERLGPDQVQRLHPCGTTAFCRSDAAAATAISRTEV